MNPVALALMSTILVGFFGSMAYALSTGAGWVVAGLAILAVAVFVRWG